MIRKIKNYGDQPAITGICKSGLESQVQGRRIAMRVRIEDTCTACGLCVDTCPEVFEMGDEMAEVIVDEVPAEHEDAVQQAADECPVEAIIVE
jgi:ferredoxin